MVFNPHLINNQVVLANYWSICCRLSINIYESSLQYTQAKCENESLKHNDKDLIPEKIHKILHSFYNIQI